MKYTTIEVHNKKGQSLWLIRKCISENVTVPIFPLVYYKNKEEAETIAKLKEKYQ